MYIRRTRACTRRLARSRQTRTCTEACIDARFDIHTEAVQTETLRVPVGNAEQGAVVGAERLSNKSSSNLGVPRPVTCRAQSQST
jgi:hypothetical protein